MIRYVVGNMLSADTQALVNTVNTVGVMGKGIALQFKERYPQNYAKYLAACKSGELTTGRLLVVKEKLWTKIASLLISRPKRIGNTRPNTNMWKPDCKRFGKLLRSTIFAALRFLL